MKRLHLRKLYPNGSEPPYTDWVVEYDGSGRCVMCVTDQFGDTAVFLGTHINYLTEWLRMGDHQWNQIVEDISTKQLEPL